MLLDKTVHCFDTQRLSFHEPSLFLFEPPSASNVGAYLRTGRTERPLARVMLKSQPQ